MTRTARFLGMYWLGIGVALVMPSPWRSLWHYVRRGMLGRVGYTAYRDLSAHSNQLASMRKIQEQMAEREAAPKPRIIVPSSRIWTGGER